jgi:uncharacterized protein (DUF1697 family)
LTTKYVALLRGINVGGAKKVKMEDLRRLVVGLGHEDVQTYLQSGNVVFGSARADLAHVAAGLEKAIADHLGLTVTVLLRTHADLAKVLISNPYLDRDADLTKLAVTFLRDHPDPTHAAGMPIPKGETAVFTVIGREIYLHCPEGYGRTKLSNAYIEKKLGLPATTRNWRSVIALHDLLGG